jgi:hypothetical protein
MKRNIYPNKIKRKARQLKKVFLVGMILVCIFTFVNIGFALQSQFYGMQVLNVSKVKDAFSVTRSKTGVTYTHEEDLVNTSITSWGTIEGETITLTITNKTKMPIEMNYFIDEYGLITKDGSSYILKIKTSIMDYPEIVNPKETKLVKIFKPAVVKLAEIKYLAIDYEFDKVVIILKRIQEK